MADHVHPDDETPSASFKRALALIDSLHPTFKPSDERPLREAMPGAWPTIGEFRSFMNSIDAPPPSTHVVPDDESLWRFWNEKAQQLAAENDRLRKALQPFAKFSSVLSATEQHRMFLQLLVCPVGDDHPDDYGRHIEAARAALATTEGQDNG